MAIKRPVRQRIRQADSEESEESDEENDENEEEGNDEDENEDEEDNEIEAGENSTTKKVAKNSVKNLKDNSPDILVESLLKPASEANHTREASKKSSASPNETVEASDTVPSKRAKLTPSAPPPQLPAQQPPAYSLSPEPIASSASSSSCSSRVLTEHLDPIHTSVKLAAGSPTIASTANSDVISGRTEDAATAMVVERTGAAEVAANGPLLGQPIKIRLTFNF
ncbi:unnamed protein product [Protopolystoma xenopodis]|uniref:Uncharacterized protein n=1 Tax=Protopolystoma xenopodis TaxID=117903 RepID=A0A3S5AHR9_9PLAT|nr:unnamed protein product [Protopolystoma xenopodis]